MDGQPGGPPTDVEVTGAEDFHSEDETNGET